MDKLNEYSIGEAVNLPSYIKSNKGLFALVCDGDGKKYHDQLCFFRCLARNDDPSSKHIEKATKQYFRKYLTESKMQEAAFDGIRLSELPWLEDMFQTDIQVYSLDSLRVGDHHPARLVQRRSGKYKKKLLLNLHEQHFSLIHNMSLYSATFVCQTCQKCFDFSWKLERHLATCDASTKVQYKNDVYRPKSTVFDKLDELEIHVDEEDRYAEYFITYDFEALLSNTATPSSTSNTVHENVHIPVSVSVCSNIPGAQQPKCFVSSGDPQALVNEMMQYCNTLATRAGLLMRRKAWQRNT